MAIPPSLNPTAFHNLKQKKRNDSLIFHPPRKLITWKENGGRVMVYVENVTWAADLTAAFLLTCSVSKPNARVPFSVDFIPVQILSHHHDAMMILLRRDIHNLTAGTRSSFNQLTGNAWTVSVSSALCSSI